MNNALILLRQFIVERYDLEELQMLCFDLGIDYEELGEGGKTTKVHKLLLFLGRESRFHELLQALQEERGALLAQTSFSTNLQNLDSLYSALPSFKEATTRPKPRPRDQLILLERVASFWLEGVLEKSLYGVPLIELHKEMRLDAVDDPWRTIVPSPHSDSPTLLPDKHIAEIFDEFGKALLILGTPGSGKTTMLLELARAKIVQAEQNPNQPVPVVFNLSSWIEGKPLADWLVNEVNEKYLIPKRIAKEWVENDILLPLLDGLDEVKEESRSLCLKAINIFRQEHGLGQIAACSRIEAYETSTQANHKLKFASAIYLQPLTIEQITDYIATSKANLKILHHLFKNDTMLEELAHSPLMLSIITLAYQNEINTDLLGFTSSEARYRHLFGTYVQQMLKRRGMAYNYTEKRMIRWLSQLAQKMNEHEQTIFLIERLQPSWLSKSKQQWIYLFGSRLISGMVVGFTLGIINESSLTEPDFLLLYGLSYGVVGGLANALIDAWRFKWDAGKNRINNFSRNALLIARILAVTILVGVVGGTLFELVGHTFVGLFNRLMVGLGFGLIFGFRGKHQSITNDIQPVETLRWSWIRALKGVLVGSVIGVVIGLGIELNDWLIFGLKFEPYSILLFGRTGAISGVMFGGLNPGIVETKGKVSPNQGIKLSGRNAIIAGCSIGFGTAIGFSLTMGPLFGSVIGLGFLILATLWYGGFDIIQHYLLRFLFWQDDIAPWHYGRFLDYGVGCILMRRIGGGYIYIHRLLMEYFATLDSNEP